MTFTSELEQFLQNHIRKSNHLEMSAFEPVPSYSTANIVSVTKKMQHIIILNMYKLKIIQYNAEFSFRSLNTILLFQQTTIANM